MAKKDYTKLEKDDLLKVIEKLESRKKYGLIWDEEKTKEQFEKESENALPVLKEVKGKEIKTDASKPTNILIEGDNYHALSVLNYTHQGKIDVIYIDPPYNTGNKDFKYNDRFVDKEDSYRHSKWLSFMSKRLRLAKNLMKEDGVIFISIDDNEIAQLKMLCDEIFGPDNFIANIARKRRGSQANLSKNISTIHEYLLCYSKNSSAELNKITPLHNENNYKNPDNDPRGPYVTMPCTNKGGSKYEIKTPTGIKYDDEWRFKKETYDRLFSDNRLVFPRKGNGKPRYKLFLKEKNDAGSIENSWWDDAATNQEATSELKSFFNNEVIFNNPKPVGLIVRILKLATDKYSIIVDFMAGSGTTGHAVLELNKEDSGNRKFILCTNNELNGFEKELREQGLSEKEIQEHGICRRVTYPRIEKVMKGYTTPKKEKVAGLGGNLKYYKTAFVKNSISRDDLKMRITRECTEMLCLREGIFDEVKAKPDYHIFEQNGRIMGVYYSMERDSLSQLKKELDKMEGEKILYCFTFDPLGLDKKDFADWKDVSMEAIPQPILDIYKEIYNL